MSKLPSSLFQDIPSCLIRPDLRFRENVLAAVDTAIATPLRSGHDCLAISIGLSGSQESGHFWVFPAQIWARASNGTGMPAFLVEDFDMLDAAHAQALAMLAFGGIFESDRDLFYLFRESGIQDDIDDTGTTPELYLLKGARCLHVATRFDEDHDPAEMARSHMWILPKAAGDGQHHELEARAHIRAGCPAMSSLLVEKTWRGRWGGKGEGLGGYLSFTHETKPVPTPPE